LNSNLTQRDHLAAAINAAERLRTDVSLEPPHTIELRGPAGAQGAYSLVLVFFGAPENLARWAAALSAPVTIRGHLSNPRLPYAEAHATVHGVAVKMWALGDEAEYDRYRSAATMVPESPTAVVPLAESPMAVA
jgi:hypothetical protein